MAYLLLCVAMFCALATGFVLASFQSISDFLTSEFLPCFLVSFLPLFMPEKIGLRQAVR
jgi:hypothetical protein